MKVPLHIARLEMKYEELLNKLEYSLGVVIYGSAARGDRTENSDLDILSLSSVEGTNYILNRNFSVAVYTEKELRVLFRRGSLFAYHIKSEGFILRDPKGLLKEIFSLYEQPNSYRPAWDTLCEASYALDVPKEIFLKNPYNFVRLARYIARSAAIILHIERFVNPCYSLGELARRLQDNDIKLLLTDHHEAAREWGYYRKICALVERMLGVTIKNPYGSIYSLICTTNNIKILTLARRMVNGDTFSFIRLFDAS